MTNLAHQLLATAAAQPDSTAIRLDDRVLSYGEFAALAGQMARYLSEEGVEAGDAVGLMMPNVVEFPIAYYAILLAGGVVVPMNPLLMSNEVGHYLSDSGARTLLAWHEVPGQPEKGATQSGTRLISIDPETLVERVRSVEPLAAAARSDSDTAVILYTSGTTGKPKGAALTHHNLRRNAEIFSRDFLELTPLDTVMGCLPLFHTFGQTNAMNSAVRRGAQLTLLSRFDPSAALEVISRDQVSVFLGVPTMYSALLTAKTPAHDVSTLRLAVSGGAPLPVEVLTQFEEQFDCPVIEGYGLSETSPTACFNPPAGPRKAGSVGIPIEGVEMRIVDDAGNELGVDERGEIAVRGHNVMSGYVGNPEATKEVLSEDGWFRTGDIGVRDEDGYFFIVDRKKSLIIRGGYNVYPREVEEALYAHPDVIEAAVVGIPHTSLGEEVGAAVVLRESASATPEEIGAYVKERVAAYKYPRQVWLLDELPKGPTGKILRREIHAPTSQTPLEEGQADR